MEISYNGQDRSSFGSYYVSSHNIHTRVVTMLCANICCRIWKTDILSCCENNRGHNKRHKYDKVERWMPSRL